MYPFLAHSEYFYLTDLQQAAARLAFDPEDGWTDFVAVAGANERLWSGGVREPGTPIGDPGYVHLTRCSPCYLEVRALQEARELDRRRWWARMAAAAVLVMAVALGAWFLISREAQPADVQAELDLRPYALMRSETPSEREPLPLPRGRLTITMILPVGFEPGEYEVQLLDSELRSRASTIGAASTENS